MPGLSFLAKKSWHTTNLDNVERVWLAEQKDAQEKKKLGELQKQLHEERQMMELRQLQVESGAKVKTVDTTLDWMYQGPSAEVQKQQSSEEYLLGKIFKPKNDVGQDFKTTEHVPEAKWLGKVSSKNDSFTRVHEDPILLIKQEEQRKRNSVINNPLKMDRIRQKIAADLEKEEAEKRAKKEKKRAKKELKKESKKRKRDKRDRSNSRSSSSDDSAAANTRRRSDSQDRDRRRSRSRGVDRNPVKQYRQSSRSRSPPDNRRHNAVDSHNTNQRSGRELSSRDSNRYTDDRRDNRYDGDRRRRDDSRYNRQTQLPLGRGREATQPAWMKAEQQERSGRHDGRDSRDEDRSRARRDVSRGDSRDRCRHDEDHHKTDRYRDRSRSRSRTPSLSPPRNRHIGPVRADNNDHMEARPRFAGQSAAADADGVVNSIASHDDKGNDKDVSRGGVQDSDDRSRRNSYTDSESDDDSGYGRKPVVKQKYGLITSSNRAPLTSSNSNSNSTDKSYLGPNPELLKQKLAKEREEQELRNNRKREDVSKLSESERLKRIKEMQADADFNDTSRLTRIEHSSQQQENKNEHTGNAVFIDSMRKEVYQASSVQGIKGRLDQNKHYTQSSADMESSGYKKN